MVTAADVRAVAMSLPRTSEHLIYDNIKFRVGKIVYVAISPDESTMGFGFPKEERAALIAAEPEKFAMPRLSDQRFHWVHARMAALSHQEMRELVTDAWRMVVPKKVAAAHLGAPPTRDKFDLQRLNGQGSWLRLRCLASSPARQRYGIAMAPIGAFSIPYLPGRSLARCPRDWR